MDNQPGSEFANPIPVLDTVSPARTQPYSINFPERGMLDVGSNPDEGKPHLKIDLLDTAYQSKVTTGTDISPARTLSRTQLSLALGTNGTLTIMSLSEKNPTTVYLKSNKKSEGVPDWIRVPLTAGDKSSLALSLGSKEVYIEVPTLNVGEKGYKTCMKLTLGDNRSGILAHRDSLKDHIDPFSAGEMTIGEPQDIAGFINAMNSANAPLGSPSKYFDTSKQQYTGVKTI